MKWVDNNNSGKFLMDVCGRSIAFVGINGSVLIWINSYINCYDHPIPTLTLEYETMEQAMEDVWKAMS